MSFAVIVSNITLLVFSIGVVVLTMIGKLEIGVLELVVWVFASSITIYIGTVWLFQKRTYKDKHFYDTEEVVDLYAHPRISIIQGVLLVLLFAFDINKLNVIWICPLLNYFVNLKMCKRVMKEDNI